MKKFFVLAGVFVSLLLLFGTADATVWYVHPDSILNSIQAGLDSCTAEDTVLVGPGTYVENIVWPNTQGIDLTSEHGRDTTIIDGNSSGSVIVCTTGVDSTTIINGFTIQNGYADNGGGIYCINSSPTIADNIIMNNAVTGNGGGICCAVGGTPTIIDNFIDGNSTDGDGGGIGIGGGASATIKYNTISLNSATNGGGIGMYESPATTIVGNVITNNTADSLAGGIGCKDSSPTIDSCEISNNDGNGVCCNIGSNPEIHYCDITGNTGYGVQNINPGFMVDAENNWWGDASGPGGFGPGTGDSVSQYVDYDPWLDHPAGIKETDDSQQMTEIRRQLLTYPNPFTTSTTITFIPPSIRQSAKDIGLKIYDLSGRLIRSVPLTTNHLTLGTDLIPGIYFLKFDDGKYSITEKLIKIR